MTFSVVCPNCRIEHADARPPGASACIDVADAEVRRSGEATIQELVRAIEHWDQCTGAHVERMSRYAALIARGHGLGADRYELIRLAAQMHDIGKVGVPDGILFKPGRLSPAEFDVVKMHAEWGSEILGRGDADLLATAAGGGLRWRFDSAPHARTPIARRAICRTLCSTRPPCSARSPMAFS